MMLHLQPIDSQNVEAILALSVREEQRDFAAPNDRSVIEAYIAITHGGHAFPFGLYDGDVPVGFVMIGYGVDDCWEDAPAIARGNYSLWRLMIDQKHQGRGYGLAAMRLALDFIRTQPCGPAEWVWLSYEPQNTVARALYRSFGFEETGEWDGEEVIAARKV